MMRAVLEMPMVDEAVRKASLVPVPVKLENSVQMNVRIGRSEKQAGDEVLASCGMTSSEAVRALWSYLAQFRELPPFMRAEGEGLPPADAQFGATVEEGAGMAVRLACQQGLLQGEPASYYGLEPLDYKRMRDDAYDEWVEETHASGELED